MPVGLAASQRGGSTLWWGTCVRVPTPIQWTYVPCGPWGSAAAGPGVWAGEECLPGVAVESWWRVVIRIRVALRAFYQGCCAHPVAEDGGGGAGRGGQLMRGGGKGGGGAGTRGWVTDLWGSGDRDVLPSGWGRMSR